jgi:hypothetical protein
MWTLAAVCMVQAETVYIEVTRKTTRIRTHNPVFAYMYIYSWIPLYTPVFSIPMYSLYPCVLLYTPVSVFWKIDPCKPVSCRCPNVRLLRCSTTWWLAATPGPAPSGTAGSQSSTSRIATCSTFAPSYMYIYMVDYLLEAARCLISFHHNAVH